MKKEDIPEWHQYKYEKKCICGNKFEILTQQDSFPEYHTDIYIFCKCGEYINFELPVN